jgi:2-polyprenyl-3-methyl-5-hydroxy-6-metoxy-1,4-benzoquinol methylase
MKLKRQLILRRNYKGQIAGLFSPLLEKIRALKVRAWIKGKSVLDCGCGRARLLSLLPKDVTYVGIDQDQPLIINNQKRCPKVKFLCANIEQQFPPAGLKFDSIVMLAVIEHFQNPQRVLEKLKSNLFEGGRIIITTPAKRSFFFLKVGSKLGLFSKEAQNEHKKLFLKQELVKLLKDSGFLIEKYTTFLFGMNQLIVGRID